MKQKMKTGPLAGLKVLDLSRVLAGPWATQVLADFGADIWKIENPVGGDDTRQWGNSITPTNEPREDFSDDDAQPIDYCGNVTAYYLSANRGKHSLAVDIKTEQGQAIIKSLANKADVIVENFKVGNLDQYGLDYSSLSQLNPKLVYCSITGFGQTGPFAQQAGYDAMIQASAGLMSLTGEKDGSPQKVGVAVSDLMTGMYAVTAVLAALVHRDKTGQGQHIDLSLFDTQVGWLANQGVDYLTSGKIPKPQGSIHPSIVPYQPIQCEDNSIMLAIGNNRQFESCCKILGLTELSSDERFSTNNQRIDNHSTLIFLLEKQFKTGSSQNWLEKLAAAEVPCGPINNLAQVFEHPQIKARSTQFSLHHPHLGDIPQIANPVKFSESPINYTKAAPMLGEDTGKILQQELNYSQNEINELKRLGIIEKGRDGRAHK